MISSFVKYNDKFTCSELLSQPNQLMILFIFIAYWWLDNQGEYNGLPNEDINWTVGRYGYYGKDQTINAMSDGALLNHISYNPRGKQKEFLDGFLNVLMAAPPRANTSKGIGQSILSLAAGSVGICNSSGIATESNLASYYFYDINGKYERLQYVICHHSEKWTVAVVPYQLEDCSDRFCRYVQPEQLTQRMISKCLYAPEKSGAKPFVFPVEYDGATDVLFSPPGRWPLVFSIAGINNRGLPLDHGAEGSGVFMGAPVADRAPIPGSLPTGECTNNFTSPNASASIFAAGLAILLEVKNSFTIPDLMFITAFTADKVQPDSVLWDQNSFGLWFNRRVGFGRLNLGKAVELARQWTSVGGFDNVTASYNAINKRLGKGTVVLDFQINQPGAQAVVFVQLLLKARALGFGSLNPHLVSPNGTRCEIKILTESDPLLNVESMEFPAYKFLGDSVNGLWKLEFHQIDDADRGIITDATIQIFYTSKQPNPALINQRRGANPFEPAESQGFTFNVPSPFPIYAGSNFTIPVTYPESLQKSNYILAYLQDKTNTSRVKVKAKFNKDFTSISLDYVPSVFKNGLEMYFVIDSLDNNKRFTASLPLEYHNDFKPGIIYFEGLPSSSDKPTGKPSNKTITESSIPIEMKNIYALYALQLEQITDDGYSSSVTQSIITYESKSILERSFSRNLGQILWKGVIPSNRHFLFQLSPSSSDRLEQFQALTVVVTVDPHNGEYSPQRSPFTKTILMWISICFGAAFMLIALRLFSLLRKKIMQNAEEAELLE